MRVLITGASGFIGSQIVGRAIDFKNAEVFATGRSKNNLHPNLKNITYFQQDLSNALPVQKFDVCIHAAGLANDQSNESEYYEANVMSTENLLNALSNCQCFIYISSSSVYDFSDGKSKKETDFGHAYKLSLYGKSKLRAEELVMRSDIASIYILRPRAVYGKGDRVLLPRILHQIKGNKMFVPGDLNVQTSLTHIDNLSEAIKLCIQKQLPGVSIYNVSDNKTYNLRAIFGAILKAKTGKGKMIHIPVSIIKTIINIQRIVGQRSNITNQSLNYLCQNSVIDNSKIYNELGYRGTKNFFESLPEIL